MNPINKTMCMKMQETTFLMKIVYPEVVANGNKYLYLNNLEWVCAE